MSEKWNKDEYVVSNLDLFNEDSVYGLFARYTLQMRDKIRLKSLPMILDDMDDARTEEIKIINKIVELYNEVPNFTYNNDWIKKYTILVRRTVSYLERYFLDSKSFNEFYPPLMFYAEHVIAGSEMVITEMQDWFRYVTYLVIMKLQVKRRRLVTGINSETGKFIYSNLKVMFPTGKLVMKSKIINDEGIDATDVPQHILNDAGSNYFIFPLSFICRTFDENDQDMLPELWSHPSFMEYRSIPDIGSEWQHFIEDGLANRGYVLPDEGVLIGCEGYGELVSIALKEVNIYGSFACYAKVSFSDGTDDIVIFNISEKIPISSGYGDMYGFENDLVLKIVAKAYMNLISAKKIEFRIPKGKDARGTGSTSRINQPSNKKQSFIYLPRTYYEGNRISGVRKRMNTTPKSAHSVVGHMRKGNASESAVEEAKKYGIEIPVGYTFVKPYNTGKDGSKRQTAKMKL